MLTCLDNLGLSGTGSEILCLVPYAFLPDTLLPVSFTIHPLLSSAASETRTLPELEKEAESS